MAKIRSQKQRRQGDPPTPPTRPPMQAVFLREGRELERTRSVSHKNSLSLDKSVTLGGERRAEGPEGKKEKGLSLQSQGIKSWTIKRNSYNLQ